MALLDGLLHPLEYALERLGDDNTVEIIKIPELRDEIQQEIETLEVR